MYLIANGGGYGFQQLGTHDYNNIKKYLKTFSNRPKTFGGVTWERI
jgi:hypothetical protein